MPRVKLTSVESGYLALAGQRRLEFEQEAAQTRRRGELIIRMALHRILESHGVPKPTDSVTPDVEVNEQGEPTSLAWPDEPCERHDKVISTIP